MLRIGPASLLLFTKKIDNNLKTGSYYRLRTGVCVSYGGSPIVKEIVNLQIKIVQFDLIFF